MLIAASPWLGSALPALDEPELRATLILSHHAWQDRPEVVWVHDPMPDDFILVGRIDLAADDLAAASDSFSGWQSVPLQALTQWRWDHDRDALLREEARTAAEQAERRRRRAEARAERMRLLTLDALAGRVWFESWGVADRGVPLGECRSAMARLVSELRAAPRLTLAVVKKLLKQSVTHLNRLDSEFHFITTIEREDLCEAFEQVACAARCPQAADLIDQWRTW